MFPWTNKQNYLPGYPSYLELQNSMCEAKICLPEDTTYTDSDHPVHMHGKIRAQLFSVVSLTSSLRVISLTVLADSISNIMIFFAEKM